MPASSRPRLVIVGHDADERAQLIRALNGSVQVLAETRDGEEALDLVADLEPDLVLVDLSLGEGPNGLMLTRWIKEEDPHQRVVVVAPRWRPMFVERALDVGAAGILDRSASPQAIQAAVDDAAHDRLILSEELVDQWFPDRHERAPVEGLGRNEAALLRAVAAGASTPREAALDLDMSPEQVDRLAWQLRITLGLHSWAHVRVWAMHGPGWKRKRAAGGQQSGRMSARTEAMADADE